ncbi:integrase catalytic domain-containing protein, partial [Trichonephila inaurata madagascariensis]
KDLKIRRHIFTESSVKDLTLHGFCDATNLEFPRLELCAAELLSKLISKVQSSIRFEISKIYLYTDLTIVVTWIDSSPHLLKVFVSNRISRIQERTKNFCWRWISTAANPAELISRGVCPDQIGSNSVWWHEPDFLYQETVESSSEPDPPPDEEYLQEFKKTLPETQH